LRRIVRSGSNKKAPAHAEAFDVICLD
jgi:hypothetical protein